MLRGAVLLSLSRMFHHRKIATALLSTLLCTAINHRYEYVGTAHVLQTVAGLRAASPQRFPTLVSSSFALASARHEDAEGLAPPSASTNIVIPRRDVLREASALSLVLSSVSPEPASGSLPPRTRSGRGEVQRITIPLEWTGEAYVLYYRIDGYLFRGIVDTGSPFLMVPGNCGEKTRARWGCYRNDGRVGVPSGLDDTYEMFDGVEGDVRWRAARTVTFVNATGSLSSPGDERIVFGVESDSLLRGPGGVFFGLMRDADERIRPSFLGQAGVRSFRIDLSSSPRTLTLATGPAVSAGTDGGFGVDDRDAVRLVSDLKRFGDPNRHYTGVASSFVVNGAPLAADGMPVYVIFDTGVTGMVVTPNLFDERYETARARREKSLWSVVSISFRTRRGTATLTARKPLTTIAEKTWDSFDGHLVVIGLSFLEGSKMTVDIDKKKLWIQASGR